MNTKADRTQLADAIARRIASNEVDKNVVREVAAELAESKFIPRRIDICQYGICIDHVVELPHLQDLLDSLLDGRLGKIEVFPWGIPVPNRFHVHIERRLEAK